MTPPSLADLTARMLEQIRRDAAARQARGETLTAADTDALLVELCSLVVGCGDIPEDAYDYLLRMAGGPA